MKNENRGSQNIDVHDREREEREDTGGDAEGSEGEIAAQKVGRCPVRDSRAERELQKRKHRGDD